VGSRIGLLEFDQLLAMLVLALLNFIRFHMAYALHLANAEYLSVRACYV
jgi:hypothetical protein